MGLGGVHGQGAAGGGGLGGAGDGLPGGVSVEEEFAGWNVPDLVDTLLGGEFGDVPIA